MGDSKWKAGDWVLVLAEVKEHDSSDQTVLLEIGDEHQLWFSDAVITGPAKRPIRVGDMVWAYEGGEPHEVLFLAPDGASLLKREDGSSRFCSGCESINWTHADPAEQVLPEVAK